MLKKKKYSVEIKPNDCKGCGRCVKACPKSVLVLGIRLNIMGFPFTSYKGDGCIGCGACFYNCPEPGTITIFEEEEGI